ncbi:hypothetical protein MMC30_004890 [Trapelia coarctata]|nr:hypothetical protein [Trapelia coarctata]
MPEKKPTLHGKSDDENAINQLVPRPNRAGDAQNTLANTPGRDLIAEGLSTLRLRTGRSLGQMQAPASRAVRQSFTFIDRVIFAYLDESRPAGPESETERDRRIRRVAEDIFSDLIQARSHAAVPPGNVEGSENVEEPTIEEPTSMEPAEDNPADDHSAEGKADQDCH